MDDIYMIEVITADNKKHLEIVTARNDLKAIDKVYEHYTKNLKQEVLDIKVV